MKIHFHPNSFETKLKLPFFNDQIENFQYRENEVTFYYCYTV